MTEPDEALMWAREQEKLQLDLSDRFEKARLVEEAQIDAGRYDAFDVIELRAEGYRAGQAASAERIKALEEENAALRRMVR